MGFFTKRWKSCWVARKGQGFDGNRGRRQCLALPRVVQASGSGEEQERENGGRAEYFPQEARKAKRSRNGCVFRALGERLPGGACRKRYREAMMTGRGLLTGRYGGRGWGCLAVHRVQVVWIGKLGDAPPVSGGSSWRGPNGSGGEGCATQAPKPLPSGARVQWSVASRTVVDLGPAKRKWISIRLARQAESAACPGKLESCLGCLSCADCIPPFGYGTTASKSACNPGRYRVKATTGPALAWNVRTSTARIPCGEAPATTPETAPSVNPAATRA